MQDREVFDVLVEVLGLGGFEAGGVIAEAGVVDDVPEGGAPEFALADAGVAVDAGAEGGGGVIQVEGEDLVEADRGLDFFEGLFPAGGGTEVIAGGEAVGGIEAEAESAGFGDAVVEGGEVGDAVAEAGALACGVFEGDADGVTAGGGEDDVEGFGGAVEAGFFSCAEVCARVEHEEREAERVGPLELLGQGFDGFVPVRRWRGGEVDEVAGVTEDGETGVIGQGLMEAGDIDGGMGAGEPLHVVLDEDLAGIGADRGGAFDGAPDTALGGHVGAEFHGRGQSSCRITISPVRTRALQAQRYFSGSRLH